MGADEVGTLAALKAEVGKSVKSALRKASLL